MDRSDESQCTASSDRAYVYHTSVFVEPRVCTHDRCWKAADYCSARVSHAGLDKADFCSNNTFWGRIPCIDSGGEFSYPVSTIFASLI